MHIKARTQIISNVQETLTKKYKSMLFPRFTTQ